MYQIYYRIIINLYKTGLRNCLVRCHEKLIWSFLTKKFKYSSERFQELFQIGVLGLIKAIECYDESKGKFSTIAYWYVLGEIQHYFRDKGNIIKLPRSVDPKSVKYYFYDAGLPDDSSESGVLGEPYYEAHHKEREEIRDLWITISEKFDNNSQEILENYYLKGLTQKEIATKLNCSSVTVAKQLRRCKDELKRIFAA